MLWLAPDNTSARAEAPMARVPTLGQIHRPTGWVWVICDRYPPCLHRAPLALAPNIIRWGADTSSDVLRRCARCTVCGHKGATLQTAPWVSGEIGIQAFPVDEMSL
jgi:hypothetical protein